MQKLKGSVMQKHEIVREPTSWLPLVTMDMTHRKHETNVQMYQQYACSPWGS